MAWSINDFGVYLVACIEVKLTGQVDNIRATVFIAINSHFRRSAFQSAVLVYCTVLANRMSIFCHPFG